MQRSQFLRIAVEATHALLWILVAGGIVVSENPCVVASGLLVLLLTISLWASGLGCPCTRLEFALFPVASDSRGMSRVSMSLARALGLEEEVWGRVPSLLAALLWTVGIFRLWRMTAMSHARLSPRRTGS